MTDLNKRMDDAEYAIKIPLCKTCRNCIMLEFDPKDPLKPTMKCRKLGEIPQKLIWAESKECSKFQRDSDKIKEYEELI